MNDLDSVIALLAASYAPKSEVTVTRNDPNYVPVVRKPKAEPKAQVVKAQTGQAVYGMIMPEKGSLDAAGFIAAIRAAGKRPFKAHNAAGEEIQVIRVEAKEVRPDTIKAIHAYIGYDPKGNFGEQEQAARSKASIEIGFRKTNGLTRGEARVQAAGSLEQRKTWGGLPDENAKRLAHLRTSETAIVEAMLAAEQTAKQARALAEEAREEEQLEYAETLAALAGKAEAQVVVEKARLECVRRDLAAIAKGGTFTKP